MDIAGSIATVLAFIFTAITFWVIFPRTRKSDQVKIASDISKELTKIVLVIVPEDIAHKKEKRHRHIQYLNVWESFALLVNDGELKNINILERFKPNLMRP
jgi:hypothetical protein